MAWLIRDNRHLLPAVRNGVCAYNSPSHPSVPFDNLDPFWDIDYGMYPNASLIPSVLFEDLDPNSFAECP